MNRRAPLLVAIGMVLLVIVVVFLAILPKMRQVTQAREDLENEQQTEAFLLAELDRLRAARAQLPEVRRRLAKFNQRVPATADLPGLIRLMQNAADASNLTFFSIAPSAPVPAAGTGGGVALPTTPPPEGETPPPVVPGGGTSASVLPATVVVIGRFFEVDQFLFRLETLPRAAKVVSINVGAGPAAGDLPGQLSVTLVVQVFTTDTTAGPGAAPDITGGGAAVPTTPAPTASPTASPTTSPSPTTTGG